MQDILTVFSEVLRNLDENRIPYMVVGSVASTIYGEPRLTKDMDVVIEISPQDISKFEKLFSPPSFYIPPHEVLTDEILNRRQFNIIHEDSGLKIDFMIRKNSAHAKEEFLRKMKMPFLDSFEAYIATAEDIIIKKLGYYAEGRSEKHITDIRGILANTSVDLAYIEKWVDRLSLIEFWTRCK